MSSPLIGSQIICGIDSSDIPAKVGVNTALTPPALLTDIPDRALRDIGKVDALIEDAAGNQATVRNLAANDALNVAIVDATGGQITSFGGGTQYAEDTAHVSGDQVTMAGVVQQSADAALSTDLDRSLLQVDATGYLKVNLKTAIPAGANNIGDVDIVGGATAHDDAGATVNPVPVGGYASDAVPTEVSADIDIVRLWLLRNGALMSALAPHLGMIADPYSLTSKTAQYTTAQTGVALWTPAAGKKIVVTSYQIQAGGTVAGTVQLWFGGSADTVYTRGTDLAIFDGEFAPSATLKPGVVQTGLWISPTIDFILRVTDSAAINPITFTIWGYEV